MGGADKYSATSSMLGYLYQCRQALLLALEETRSFPNLSVSVERFDDVAFDEAGTPTAQIQAKHHTTAGELTDSSPDIWKTLRIWAEQVSADPKAPFERRFVILTTGTAPEGSAASKLRAGCTNEDRNASLAALVHIATSSANKATAAGRIAFLALTPQQRQDLIAAVRIFDQAPDIINTRSEIEACLRFAAPEDNISGLVDHLEGWWFSSIIRSLSDATAPSISLLALRQKVDEIGGAYRRGELQLSENIDSAADEGSVSSNQVFVQQLISVSAPQAAIEMAIRDYRRANAQRSSWARENVLLDGESQRYDDGLVDGWQRQRLAMNDTHSTSTDEDKCAFGRALFNWANRVGTPFRNRHEAWLCSGSYHVLADRVRLGWHPDYDALFQPGPGE